MKKIKRTELYRIDYDGNIDEVIARLQKLKEEYPQYETLEIVEDSCYEGGYTYELYGCSIETDEQEKSREDAEETHRLQNEAFQRRQYELLKAKFEPEKP